VPTGVTPQLDDQVAEAIDDKRVIREVGRGVDEAGCA
jgi:hypothetical protein